MSVSTRPSVQQVQRSLIVGAVVGLILGCLVGAGLVGLYIRQNPPVYQGGAYPSELTTNYQDHYIAMVVDSYLVNRQVNLAQERLKSFDTATKIRTLGRRSADFVANGQAVEAQAVNDLAAALQVAESWPPETISAVGQELTSQYQGDSARIQALTTYIGRLGQVPAPAGQEQPAPAATQPGAAATTAPPAAAEAGGFPWLRTLLLCLLALIVLVALVWLLLRILGRRKPAKKPAIVWEGEGPAPIKQWTGTYRHGMENYDEFFTIETESGDFLGESGVGILESIPNTSPKQVTAFDVGLFDKTDITTLSRVIMTEAAYNDPAMMAKVDANPQAEAILAKPGTEFSFETSALRVQVKIDDMAYGEGGNTYFDYLKISLGVFVKEGADLRIGTMDVPEQYR